VTSSSTGAKHEPLLDEAGFEQLLAAAYVLQQHNDNLRAKNPHIDPVAVLCELVEGNTSNDPREPTTDRVIPPDSNVERMLETDAGASCRACGHQFGADEEFCGSCGLSRALAISSEDLQGKWASLWYKQRAQAAVREEKHSCYELSPATPIAPKEELSAVRLENVEDDLTSPGIEENIAEHATPIPSEDFGDYNAFHLATIPDVIPTPSSANPRGTPIWESVRKVLEALRDQVHTTRDAAIATGSAVLLLILVLWSLWPTDVSAKAGASWFDSVLAKVGLADAPAQASSYSGNSDIRVWVDVHTALYYCPGSDLYGKTPGGHFSRQQTAQKDQFEPASGNACQ